MQQTDSAFSRSRPWVSAVHFCAVAVAGTIAGWLQPLHLGYWPMSAQRRLGADWLCQHGYHRLEMHWILIWPRLPLFLLAMLLGACVGLLLPRRWLQYGLVCGLALLAANEAWAWVHGVSYYQMYGRLHVSPYDVAPIPILLLVAWLASRLRPAPILPGHCRNCGYNLTGNVSGLCPECGTRSVSAPMDAAKLPDEGR